MIYHFYPTWEFKQLNMGPVVLQKNISEIYHINKLAEGTFLLYFKIIDCCQQEQPSQKVKLDCEKYLQVFYQGRNII